MRRTTLVALIALLLVGCDPAPSPSAIPSAAASPAVASEGVLSPSATTGTTLPTDLRQTSGALPPGTYTRSDFRPPITFEVGEGWFVGSVTAGFFDVQQQQGTPDVIAVQFALPGGVVGANGATIQATSAGDAVAAIKENPGLVTIDESESRLGGQTGTVLEVENPGPAPAPIFDVPAGRLGIDADRRLWIALFDTPDGVLAVMVGGSTADWEHALTVAEPVLESIVIST
jgi:hypothetical protein